MEEEELSILDAKMASEPTFGGPEAAFFRPPPSISTLPGVGVEC